MKPINRALNYIEEKLAEDIRVEDIAHACAISPFHLSRVFNYLTGYPLGRYLRLRRLSESAKLLASTDSDILSIALEVGYDSHAVFSRAFKAEFGITPREFRLHKSLLMLNLLQPITWSSTMNITIPTPKEETNLSLTVIGASHRFTGDKNPREFLISTFLPKLWARFSEIKDQAAPGYLQIIKDAQSEDVFDWFSGMTVSKAKELPQGLESTEIHWERYLAFPFCIIGDRLRDFIEAIYSDWLPTKGLQYRVAEGSHIQWLKNSPNISTPEEAAELIASREKIEGEIWIPIL
ncbi:AraC family transcriptional regulator [Dongshaea marina]|uniref:AraC family transcriptional regulator n=1 Tax=Dongshaea marina TaxID=2047966 RepID=UPI000D3E65D5|nr:helix-turn-helix domain-containing protein [Dongshaea marina]